METNTRRHGANSERRRGLCRGEAVERRELEHRPLGLGQAGKGGVQLAAARLGVDALLHPRDVVVVEQPPALEVGVRAPPPPPPPPPRGDDDACPPEGARPPPPGGPAGGGGGFVPRGNPPAGGGGAAGGPSPPPPTRGPPPPWWGGGRASGGGVGGGPRGGFGGPLSFFGRASDSVTGRR